MTRAFGPNEVYVGGANFELADLHHGRGNFVKAAQAARAAVAAFTAALGERHNYTMNANATLAAVELDLGEPAAALRVFEALKPIALADKDGAPMLAAIDFGRAKALTQLGRPEEALALLNQVNATQLANSSWGPPDFEWQLQAEKGRALIGMGQRAQGADKIRAALPEMEKAGSYRWQLERYRELLHNPPRMARR